ncbi:MAG: 2,3 cyclic-nucleotide 2-phosphodiesterase, partial [Deltaproteobacteria bacterium]|nr:2,3 cyclic-nucleotide 2-phosphodiesterase [Deltaproteobacteria bacterium]
MSWIQIIGIFVVGILLGLLMGFWTRKRVVERQYDSIRNYSKKIINEAHKRAKALKKDAAIRAKDTLYQMKLEFDRESKEKKEQMAIQEKRLEKKLFRKEKDFEAIEEDMKAKQAQLEEMVATQRKELERVAGLSSDEAKALLIGSLEEEAKADAAKLMRRIENETREAAQRKAQEILGLAIKRYAGDYVAEKTVSVVSLPNEEMKGRIIGREGRNIRAIEAATGIDVIIDDTPEAVILSGFNPVRREVAKIALERLIDDGRIHPARIEEMVDKVNKEIEAGIKEAGEQAAFDLGVHGMDPEIIKLVGRLKYRTSFAQNVFLHSIEVGFLCGVMASELGLNVKQAKRAGLLHDIGKAVDHEVEGPHALIGAELAKKYNEAPQVIHAIAAHHEEVAPESVLAVLVQA